jgi:hypothetical protein
MWSTSLVLMTLLLADAKKPSPEAWTVLFDGTSTSAWRGYRQPDFPSGCWTTSGGELTTVAGAKSCDIITREKYRDFEIQLEWKVGPGGNSGILYRASELPEPAPIWHVAPEYQILDDTAHPDARPVNLTGGLYDLVAPENKVIRAVGEWNTAGVVVKGNKVEHWLNGKKVLEYELGSPALQALIAKSKFKDLTMFAKEQDGYVGLQHHGEQAAFRNIRIRRLP